MKILTPKGGCVVYETGAATGQQAGAAGWLGAHQGNNREQQAGLDRELERRRNRLVVVRDAAAPAVPAAVHAAFDARAQHLAHGWGERGERGQSGGQRVSEITADSVWSGRSPSPVPCADGLDARSSPVRRSSPSEKWPLSSSTADASSDAHSPSERASHSSATLLGLFRFLSGAPVATDHAADLRSSVRFCRRSTVAEARSCSR